MQRQKLNSVLLAWYDRQARDLAWRAKNDEPRDPYRIWLSEIMLQQTTVATVKGYFDKFISRWPTVRALADAELDDVLSAWAGLGYYARARNLHKCAIAVAHHYGGVFPATPGELRALPGIGPYTANAIAAIGFDYPVIAVDGNVERVFSRLFAIEDPLPAAKPMINDRAVAMAPVERAGDFTQALMDLGAMVCTPKRANCLLCPLADLCAARAKGIANLLPKKAPKKPKPTRHGVAFFIERSDGAILLRRRPEEGLLGGMMEVPSFGWDHRRGHDNAAKPPFEGPWSELAGEVLHTFTHFHLRLTVQRARVDPSRRVEIDKGIWVKAGDLNDQALPTVMKKVLIHALGADVFKR